MMIDFGSLWSSNVVMRWCFVGLLRYGYYESMLSISMRILEDMRLYSGVYM